MTNLLKNKRGVTLVELLAVIIILGIIAAIAIPTIGNLIENQKRNAAELQWANIIEAARLYDIEVSDNDGEVTLAELITAGNITIDTVNDYVFTVNTDAAPTVFVSISNPEIIFDISGSSPVLADLEVDSDPYDNLWINGFQVAPAV